MKKTPLAVKNSLSLCGLLALGLNLALVIDQAQAQCPVYPIALSSSTLVGVTNGTVLHDIFNGSQPGNFGWLSWTGAPDEPTLAASLTVPGNSSNYVNPDDPTDHIINVGDWVTGKPGVSNGSSVRDALDALEDYEILVPVWDQVRNGGSNAAYRVSAFARVRIIGYRLPSQNRISAIFLGYDTCGTGV